jgi:hypothetical protein
MKAPTYNPTFDCFEDFYGGRYARVVGTYAASGTVTITLTGAGSSSGAIFTVGDVIKNARTGECLVVLTASGSTSITVSEHGWGSTAAAAGADGDGLYIIGNVNEENSTSRNVNTTQATKQTNYTFFNIWV